MAVTPPIQARSNDMSSKHILAWLAIVQTWPWPWRMAVGGLVASAGALLLASFDAELGRRFTFILFVSLVGGAAFVGGAVSGVAAALLSLVFINLMLHPSSIESDWTGLVLFLAISLALSYAIGRVHSLWLRLRAAEARLAQADDLGVMAHCFQSAIAWGEIGAWDLDIKKNAAMDIGAFRQIFGFSLDVTPNPDQVYQLVVPEDLPAMKAALQAALDPSGDGVYRAEYRILRRNDGELRWLKSSGQTVFENGEAVRIVGLTRDITGERVATAALTERTQLAERFSNVAAAAPGVIFSLRRGAADKNEFTFASAKASAVLGIDPLELVRDPQPFYARIQREDRATLAKSLANSASHFMVWRGVFRYDHPQKGQVWIEAQGAPALQQNGDVIWHGYACDVSDRALSEMAVAEHAARLQAIIDGARDGVFTLSRANKIISVNKAGLAIFKCVESQMIGRDFSSLFPGSESGEAAPMHDVQDAHAGTMVDAQRADGSFFPAEIVVNRVAYDHSQLAVAFVSDLSDRERKRRRIEELTLERLSAISQMAATLAHQINQPLTAASAYMKVALRLLARLPDDNRTEIAQTIDKASAQMLRAGQIVRSLRELVAHGEPDKTLVSLNALIEETLALVAPQASDANIEITRKLASGHDLVVADRVQIKQVLSNLIRNAMEAMHQSPRRELSVNSRTGNGAICVEVCDTGMGLSDIDGADLFEPFTSKKERGMGIGLSISREIVESHYGKLWAKPNPDGGAVFGFELPLSEQEPN